MPTYRAPVKDTLFVLEAVAGLLSAMEMQEGRESEAFHIKQDVALCIWNDAKDFASAAIKKAKGEVDVPA
jgi:hypothetical protein